MSDPSDWAKAFALQADADFKTWECLQIQKAVPRCHGLMFLQMACETLCKAYRIASGTSPGNLQASHAHITKNLPSIIRQEISFRGQDVKKMRGVYQTAKHLAEEIEVLSPAVDRNGQRPDNCEYPWEDSIGLVHSPLDWTFHPSRMLTERGGPAFLKFVRLAIHRLLARVVGDGSSGTSQSAAMGVAKCD